MREPAGASTAEEMFVGGGRVATGLRDLTTDPAALDSAGFWAVLVTFEGEVTCARFSRVRDGVPTAGPWSGPRGDAWSSSMDEAAYSAAVRVVRERIASGGVYQANLCRILSAPLPGPVDVLALGALLRHASV